MKITIVLASLLIAGAVYAAGVQKSSNTVEVVKSTPVAVVPERPNVQIVHEGKFAGALYLDTLEFFGDSTAAIRELWSQVLLRQEKLNVIAQVLTQPDPAQTTPVTEPKRKTKKK